MSKITDITKLIPPAEVEKAAEPDIITRINETIINFRQLIQDAGGIKGAQAPGQEVIGNRQLASPGRTQAFIDFLVANMGDKTIGEILSEFSPMPLKEFVKGLRDVGLIK